MDTETILDMHGHSYPGTAQSLDFGGASLTHNPRIAGLGNTADSYLKYAIIRVFWQNFNIRVFWDVC